MYKGSRAKKMLRLVNSHEENYNFASEQNEDDADHTPALVEECLPVANSDQSATPVLQSPESNIADNSFLEDDDDSVKDPNYKSSSSSRSSSSCGSCSSSGSSCSSKTASSPHTAVNTTMSIHIAHSTHTQNMVDTESSNKENDSLLHNENIVLESIGTEIQEMSQNHDETVENDVTLTTEDDKTKKNSRKRLARVDEWLSNKAKKLRNTGQEYVSRSKSKKIVPARTLKPACGITCKMQCSFKVDEDNRKAIFAKYWELGDITLQRNFISNCTKVIKPAIRFSGKEKPRNYNNAYYFNINGGDVRVCKKFFMATLDINDRVVRTVLQKKELGFVEVDKRGKHGNHKKVDETIKQSVRDHINSIPRIDSHYTRKSSSREFIDGGKCITDLHEDYKKARLEQGRPAAHYEMYAKIFNTEFNISFFIPKKDRCELCVSYENSDDSGKEKLKHKYTTHLQEKVLARQEKENDKSKSSSDYIVAVYDLQAVLQTPRGDVSVFYYKSKLNNFNFSITQLGSDHTECYLWHEGEANRGADEIGSCVLNFIDKIMANYSGDGAEFVFFSDNCCGQQKNRFIFSMYMYALKKFPKIKSITHKYLITGHTQNEGDAVHSTVEKAIKKSLRSGPIYVPSQYATIIRNAKKRGQPFSLKEMSYNDFLSMKNLADDIGFNTKNLKVSDIKVIKMIQGEPSKCFVKYSYNDNYE